MGRFHRHADGTVHEHDHDHDHDHEHEHDEHGHRDVGDHSGYVDTGTERVAVLETILAENDRTADENRADFAAAGVVTVNLMSSPGAGKTTLLKRTITTLGPRLRLGVLEGDIATSLDADELERPRRAGGAREHQPPASAASATSTPPWFGPVSAGCRCDDLDLLVIENVGNLVCPAEFDVGQHARAMVYAVTEGEEKPLKYPVMFRACDVVVVNKIDLLPHLDFDLDRFVGNVRDVNPAARLLFLSARTGDGLDEWCDWLVETSSRHGGRGL